jgi:glycolate oxidase FAD binding subunit
VIEHLSPATLEEACDIVRERAALDAAIAIAGGGTESALGYDAERVDVTIDTKQMNRVIDYAAEDLVVSVEAGMTLADLRTTLAPFKQRLALDPAWPEHATIGGLLASNAYGPRRARYGTLRDLIVGITIVRADGTAARGGGKVVKNVAGFDLPKLMVGSLGTLGLIARATFRLHPVPERERWYEASGLSAESVTGVCRALFARQLEPAAIVARADADGARFTLQVLFEGFEAGVDAQGARWLEIARGAGAEAEDPGPSGVTVLDETCHPQGPVRIRISAPPADFVAIDRDTIAPLREGFRGEVVAYPTVGAWHFGGRPRDGADPIAAIARARAACEARGGNLVVAEMVHELRDAIDPWGTLPASFPIMRNLKNRFDPARRFNRGRFLGRL